jgi:hypothetical protein
MRVRPNRYGPVVLTLALGAAVVVMVRGHLNRSHNDHESAGSSVVDDNAGPGRTYAAGAAVSFDRLRMAEIENRLSAIETAGATPANQQRQRPSEVARPPTEAERQIQIDQDFRDHQERVKQSASEARNDAWASPMEQKIGSSFQRIPSEVQAKYLGAECRSSTCVVRFEWPSHGAAENELRLAVGSFARTGCQSALALPPAVPGSSARVEGDVLLTCGGGVATQ